MTNYGSASMLPSHPIVPNYEPFSTPPNDSRGLTYFADWGGPQFGGNNGSGLQPRRVESGGGLIDLFPELEILNSCKEESSAQGSAFSNIASFLMQTSTSHEGHDDILTDPSSTTQSIPSTPALSINNDKTTSPISSISSRTRGQDSLAQPIQPPTSAVPASSPMASTKSPQLSQPLPSEPPPENSSGSQMVVTSSPALAKSPMASSASTRQPLPSSPSSSNLPLSALPTSSPPVSHPASNDAAPTPAPSVSTSTAGPTAQSLFPYQLAQSLTVGSIILPVSTVAISTVISGTMTTVPGVAFGAHTVPVGSRIDLFGTLIAVVTASRSTHIVIDASTLFLSSIYRPVLVSTVRLVPPVIAGSTVTANFASQYITSGQTLTSDATITVGTGTSTTVIALQTSSSRIQLVIGTSTSVLLEPSILALVNAPNPFSIGTETITANSISQYIVAGQIISPGGPAITISGAQISIAQIATVGMVIPNPSLIDIPSPKIIGTKTITTDSHSQYIIASHTLSSSGPAITVSGTPMSLAPSETAVIVGTSTSGLGGYIMSGIGAGQDASSTNTAVAQFTGGAEALMVGRGCGIWGLGILAIMVGIGLL